MPAFWFMLAASVGANAAVVTIDPGPQGGCPSQALLAEDLLLVEEARGVEIEASLAVVEADGVLQAALQWSANGEPRPWDQARFEVPTDDCDALRRLVSDRIDLLLDSGRPTVGVERVRAPLAVMLGGALATSPWTPRARLDLRGQAGDRWRGEVRAGIEVGAPGKVHAGARESTLATQAALLQVGPALHLLRADVILDATVGAVVTHLGTTPLLASAPRWVARPGAGVGVERLVGEILVVAARADARLPVTLQAAGQGEPVYVEPAVELVFSLGAAIDLRRWGDGASRPVEAARSEP